MTESPVILNKKNIFPSLTSEQLATYAELLKQRAQFYREENAKMEVVFEKLKIPINDFTLVGLRSDLEGIDKILQVRENSNMDKIYLNEAECLRKRQYHLAKLEICIKHYCELNEGLLKQWELLNDNSEHAKQLKDMLRTHPQNMMEFEEKVKKYESTLRKFEVKYPWLKDNRLDMPNIAALIEHLHLLKEQKETLVKELHVYHGLKPNITEAKEQLSKIKQEFKNLCDKF
ncbi:hypothetical protein ABEB36_010293 [Hypothenemus hampei]|uniref:Uncharacterized protein n=1 Tax=Hypothenemus hampei TaxID=57062 RepID=A0ABD1EJM7_HYPHA